MSTTAFSSSTTAAFRPWAAASIGFVVYALAVVAGYAFDINADSPEATFDLGEWAVTALIALLGAAIAVWAGQRAWRSDPRVMAGMAVVLSIVAAVTLLAFWAGWSTIFGAVAVALVVEHRRRLGSLSASAGTAMIVGLLAFAVGTFLCVTG